MPVAFNCSNEDILIKLPQKLVSKYFFQTNNFVFPKKHYKHTFSEFLGVPKDIGSG